jgi:hypothetical protein
MEGGNGGGGVGGDVLIWRRPMAPIFRPDDDKATLYLMAVKREGPVSAIRTISTFRL